MPSPLMEGVKREAIVSVLSKLGDDIYRNLERSLWEEYAINLKRSDDYTLEELHIVLQRLFGRDGSNLLMRDIHNRIEILAKPLE